MSDDRMRDARRRWANMEAAKLLGWEYVIESWDGFSCITRVVGIAPDGMPDFLVAVPNCAGDLDALMKVLPKGYELSLSHQGSFYHAGISPVNDESIGWGFAHQDGYAYAATKALGKMLQERAKNTVKQS